MRGIHTGVVCTVCLWVQPLFAQSSEIAPMRVSAGEVLTFHSQSRLIPSSDNPLDALPKGTILRVKILDTIDSNTETDGITFRGTLDSPLADGHNATIAQEHAEVRGLLVLLRSRTHPEGFRYELLLTGIRVQGKMQDLTATLNASLFDAAKRVETPKPPDETSHRESSPGVQPTSPGNSNAPK